MKIGNEYKNIFSKALSLINNNSFSNSFGSADRNYWHNKDGKGYSVDSYQVMCAGFALDYKINAKKISKDTSIILLDRFLYKYNKKKFLEEYFCNQDSYCALTYNIFFSLIASILIKDKKRINEINNISNDLLKKKITVAANQSITTICSLIILKKKIPQDYLNFLDQLPLEYHNLDLGYLLKITSIIAWTDFILCFEKRKTPIFLYSYYSKIINILNFLILKKNLKFDLSYRGNRHLLLSGLKYFEINGCHSSKKIKNTILNNKIYKDLVKINYVDDKYFAFFHFNNFVFESTLKYNIFKKKSLNRLVKINQVSLSEFGLFNFNFKNHEIIFNKFLSFQVNKNNKFKFLKNFSFIKFDKKLFFFHISNIEFDKKHRNNYIFKLYGSLNEFDKNNFFIESLFFRSILSIVMMFNFMRKFLNLFAFSLLRPKKSSDKLGYIYISLKDNNYKTTIKLSINKTYQVKNMKYFHPINGHSSRYGYYE